MIAPEHVINVSEIEELSGIEFTADGVEIGACTKIADIGASKELDKDYHALCFANRSDWFIPGKNNGYSGGNVAHSLPAGETHTPLAVLDAQVVIESIDGEKEE